MIGGIVCSRFLVFEEYRFVQFLGQNVAVKKYCN